jgi:hypothetical protein
VNKYEKTFYSTDSQEFSADVYSVLDAFGVSCPAVQHAVKKLLMPGQRGAKSELQDLDEALVSVCRAIDMARARLGEGGTLTGETEPEPEPMSEPEPVAEPESEQKPKGKKCLYVWRDFAPDYKNGLAVAVATSADEAERLIVRRLGYNPDNWGPVEIYDIDGYQLAWAVTGGQ